MAKENINVSIFTVLKVSEVSGVPVLLMSNPGVGKSTTVSMFAEVRGYHLELLRGNSTSETEILGYDVADTAVNSETTKHLRPSWFTNILEKEKEGIPTLLFLDEITTANSFVQAALLHLVFERHVGKEPLPKSTMIVSAGNFAQNLDHNMNMLPPLMNRFLIFNVIPKVSDLDTFLGKYTGAIASMDGEPVNQLEELKSMMKALDNQEEKIERSFYNKIGEHVERCIKEVTKLIWGREKLLDLAEKELKDIYSDMDDEEKLYGFVTFRTLNYLRDVTLATFVCFGKAGLVSDNYRNMIDGLCGIGIVKDPKTKNIKINKVGKNYFDQMRLTVNEIEKMKNSSLPKYERFFFDVLEAVNKRDSKKKIFEKGEIQSVIAKVNELNADSSVAKIERPLDISVIKGLCDSIADTAHSISDIKVPNITTGGSSSASADPTMVAGRMETWNLLVEMHELVGNLLFDTGKNYDKDAKETIQNIQDKMKKHAFRLMSIRKVLTMSDTIADQLIPKMRELSSF